MFLTLLAVTFVISVAVCWIVERVFARPVRSILDRVVTDRISGAWVTYIRFAIYVVGISGGVRIGYLEHYVNPRPESERALELTLDRWVLEVYRTVIGALQSLAWMLLVFFIVALIAYVIVRIFESRRGAWVGRAERAEGRE